MRKQGNIRSLEYFEKIAKKSAGKYYNMGGLIPNSFGYFLDFYSEIADEVVRCNFYGNEKKSEIIERSMRARNLLQACEKSVRKK